MPGVANWIDSTCSSAFGGSPNPSAVVMMLKAVFSEGFGRP